MNLPNKLTVIRVLMIPLFLAFYFIPAIPWHMPLAFFAFVAASLTDMLDGMIARKYNLVTDFGKLMDPLADKLLTLAAFVCLLSRPMLWGALGLILLTVIISREFIVTSIRLVAAEKGVVLAADKWGKLKTIAQMTWISQELLFLSLPSLPPAALTAWRRAGLVLLCAAVLLTVGSGINYAVKNKSLFENR
jgi:CDP-diacylglycerol--glycerol-3-phosphate 3-phosphatidyltransferase